MTKLNPVVQKIAEQAKGFVDLNQHVGGGNGCMIYTYEGLNKFAELIVAECADFLRDTMDDHFAAEQLEEHFGVES
jgi:hypothetical protein